MLASASLCFRSGFWHQVNAIISSLKLLHVMWFLFSHSTALIPALPCCLHSCSTKSAVTYKPQSLTNYVVMHLSTFASTSLNTLFRYIENRMSDNRDSCGTLISTLFFLHWCPSMTRSTILPNMNNSVYLTRSSSAPMSFMVRSRQFLLMWSNSPFTYISTIAASFLSVQASCTRLNNLTMTSINFLFFLNSIQHLWSMWFISHHCVCIFVCFVLF